MKVVLWRSQYTLYLIQRCKDGPSGVVGVGMVDLRAVESVRAVKSVKIIRVVKSIRAIRSMSSCDLQGAARRLTLTVIHSDTP